MMRKVVQIFNMDYEEVLDVEFNTEQEAEAWIFENAEREFGGRMSDIRLQIRTIYTDSLK